MKFGRNYRLTIEGFDGSAITVQPPLTLTAKIHRAVSASLNHAEFEIYNLAESTRNRIFKDRFSNLDYKRIVFEAGYGDELSSCFIGSIFEASSARRGTDIITRINARDGGFDTVGTKTFRTENKGITLRDLLRGMIGGFPNLEEGSIGELNDTFKRPIVLEGNTFGLIKKYSEDSVFIDLERVNILADNEAVQAVVPLINADTGLLETPRRDDAFLTITTLFEPRIIMGQIVELRSQVQKIYDGQYKVIGVNHDVIISESVGGQARSTFNLLLDGQLFGRFRQVGQN